MIPPSLPQEKYIIELFEALRENNKVKTNFFSVALGLPVNGWSKIVNYQRKLTFHDYISLCNFFKIPLSAPLEKEFDYRKYIKKISMWGG
jgi:hypothetical protein